MDSTIQRLPTEVLGEVFDQVLDPDIADPSSETMEQLIEICLVCREWRHAALITHKLWRTLALSETLSPRAFKKARKWLGRAKTLSVGLAVGARTGHTNHCYERANCSLASPAFAEILLEGTLNLYHLGITCPSSVCFYQFLARQEEWRRRNPLRAGPHPWNGIKSLKIVFEDDWNQWEDSVQNPGQDILTSLTYPIFRRLPPAVTSLSLLLPSFDHEVESAEFMALNIPPDRLHNLTELTLTCDWHAGIVLRALESCRNVERLTLGLNKATFLRDPDDGLSIEMDNNATLLPAVRKLQIRQLDPQALEYLRYFRTPLLEELDLEFTTTGLHRRLHQPPFSMEVVIELLQRSQCTVTLSRVWLRHAPFRDVRHIQSRLPFMSIPRFFAERQGDHGASGDVWMISRAMKV